MDIERLETDYVEEIQRLENIRQIYLDDDRIDVNWVNNRIDNFIDIETKRYQRYKRIIQHKTKNN